MDHFFQFKCWHRWKCWHFLVDRCAEPTLTRVCEEIPSTKFPDSVGGGNLIVSHSKSNLHKLIKLWILTTQTWLQNSHSWSRGLEPNQVEVVRNPRQFSGLVRTFAEVKFVLLQRSGCGDHHSLSDEHSVTILDVGSTPPLGSSCVWTLFAMSPFDTWVFYSVQY